MVYLPAGCDWYDFRTGKRHTGGQTITAAAPLDSIPVFVRSGTILPLGPVMQSTSETSTDPIELRVYPGADADFTLYEDAGDGNGYQRGEYVLTPLHWDEQTQQLNIGERKGSFPGMTAPRNFRVVVGDKPAPRIPSNHRRNSHSAAATGTR